MNRIAPLLLLALANSGLPLLAQSPGSELVRAREAGPSTWVLISGMVGGVAGFRALATALRQDDSRVIIIDPYRLSLDSQDVSYAALARRVHHELRALTVRDAHVIGHANGAGVALRLAEQAPERVASLTFLDAGALRTSAGKTLRGSMRFVPMITRIPGGRSYVRRRLAGGIREHAGKHAWFTDSAQSAYLEPMLNDISRVVALALRLGTTIEVDTVESMVSRLRVPVTVILGSAPHASAVGSEEIAALRPIGTRLTIIRLPDIGHFPHEEDTQVVAHLLDGVRRRVAPMATVQP